MKDFEYRRAEGEEAAKLEEMLAQALMFPRDQMKEWFEGYGAANFRLVARGGKMLGGFGFAPMGQWFGGRCVPAAGIMMVGMAPEARGQGAAGAMLRQALEEMRERGQAIAPLFASQMAFYRKYGWERAGAGFTLEVKLASLGEASRELRVSRSGAEELARLEKIHRARAAATEGNLDRHAYIWKRMLAPHGGEAHTYVIEGERGDEGFFIFAQGRPMEPMRVLDYCALTRGAAERIWTFFRDHRPVADVVRVPLPPSHAAMQLLPEQRVSVLRGEDWMLRIVDAKRAIEARGYRSGEAAELHFELRDETAPWNAGKFIAAIEGGRATARAGGEGRLKISERGFAAMYSGHLTVREIAWMGWAEGDERELEKAGRVFAGERPWMGDRF